MSKDPAFLFYPGDYLRDTQCLSEPAQVAYDRIMCEHMRNICITQDRLTFFTKRLNVDQRAEILSVLTVVSGGFQITWVADSIIKRREYSDSRRKNREGKPVEERQKQKKTSKSYVSHMENEIEDVNGIGNKNGNRIGGKGERIPDSDFADYELWTQAITDNTDHIWEPMYMNSGLRLPPGRYIGLVNDHLQLLARYPKMKPPNQQAFRHSLLKHITDNKDKQVANGAVTNKTTNHGDSLIKDFAERHGSKTG